MSIKSICGALALVSMVSVNQAWAAPAAEKKEEVKKESTKKETVKKEAKAPAAAAVWKIDTAHSDASFSVRHMMISNVKGHFSKVTGTVDYDGKDLKNLKIDAQIDVASVDTGDKGRDEHLKGADFFDAAKYPTITFKSTKVKSSSKGKFSVTGELTMHGVTKEVTLAVEGPAPEIKDQKGGIKTGASATAKINRKDFGLTWNKAMDGGGVMIGEEIPVTIEVEAAKQ